MKMNSLAILRTNIRFCYRRLLLSLKRSIAIKALKNLVLVEVVANGENLIDLIILRKKTAAAIKTVRDANVS